jgi:hypothetical protein
MTSLDYINAVYRSQNKTEITMQKSNRKFWFIVAVAALVIFGSLTAGFAADTASAKAVFYVQ